jgi:hypothetical protein
MKRNRLWIFVVLLFTGVACTLPSIPVHIKIGNPFAPPTKISTSDSGTKVIRSDDFSDPESGWPEEELDVDRAYYQDGAYYIEVNEEQTDIWAHSDWDLPDDVRIEVDATKVDGPDDNDFGIICRYVKDENGDPSYYLFLISSDGYAGIAFFESGTLSLLSGEELAQTSAIAQGNATNHIRADCVGNTLTLYVNGKHITRVTDSSLPSGTVGLLAGTYDEPGTVIKFENLVIYEP